MLCELLLQVLCLGFLGALLSGLRQGRLRIDYDDRLLGIAPGNYIARETARTQVGRLLKNI